MPTANTPITPTQREAVIKILNNQQIANMFGSLQNRWQDEQEYEDINDYAIPLKKLGLDVVKMVKRPFAAHVRVEGVIVSFRVDMRKGRFTAKKV